jgi:hypothetical protein
MGFNTSLGLAGSYSLTPSPSLTVSDQNYIDFTSSATAGWAQQYLPELYEQEVERYGNRTIGGFLQMVGAEMPMTSDQIIWSEQNRLHIAYKNDDVTANSTVVVTTASSGLCTLGSALNNSLRVGNTVIVTDNATGLKTLKCYVSAVSSQTFTLKPYTQDELNSGEVTFSDSDKINVFVYGSEFAKGSSSMSGELKPSFTQFSNRPLIIKDHFKIDGSDTAQIGWVETTDESLNDFDNLLKNLDKQGAIEENMLYVNRELALTIDDMVAGLNANYQGGASFGVFENDADMALNLGFSAFRRGSYDFYKSDWKYLNDASARGGFGDISGILIPAGTSTVYDQSLGKNMTRPFLHVRYRTSQTDDRRLKSWVTGSVGSATYTGDDIMEVHYLSERCLVVQGANNFVLLKES